MRSTYNKVYGKLLGLKVKVEKETSIFTYTIYMLGDVGGRAAQQERGIATQQENAEPLEGMRNYL